MSLTSRSLPTILAIAALAAATGCASDDGGSPSTTSSTTSELDVIGLAERPASLLVLSPTATAAQRRRLEATLSRLGGAVLESQAPRLVIAQVPDGAEAALTQLGVVARFDRAVTGADLDAPTLAEERFLSVHAARWFPAQVPSAARIAPTFVRRASLAQAEAPPQRMPANILPGEPGPGGEPPVIDPEDQVSVPYASGTVVVSIVLPESNGSIDASTEDWNEDLVRQTYLKVQAAVDAIAAAEPNADLRFVVHYESAPTAGGLPGTVDTGYEFGQRAQWGSSTEFLATADVLGKILGKPVSEGEVWTAALEYDAKLKRQYEADAAFFVIVAANGNFTAGLRAHAWLNGPWTVLDSSYGWETFTHEFGHIFGALDEYCPDACVPPTAMGGYLGMYNGNAFSNELGGGIDNGRGEAVTSLMESNNPGAINGYTRGAWGWLDTDGDGLLEVRDTFPKSELTATALTGQRVRLTGRIVDRGEGRAWGGTRYSSNRIVALEYAIDAATGPWFRVPLAADTRGRQAVDLELTGIKAGARTLFVRGVSSVGNVEPAPVRLAVTTTGTGNTAPHLRLDLPVRAGTAAPVTITTTTRDLDGDAVTVRYDLDGNGSWDTTYGAPGPFRFTPAAGVITVKAQARDARGATRVVAAELPVVTGDAAPVLALSNLASLVHGTPAAATTLTATATDPEGQAVALHAITELATSDDRFRVESPLGADGRLAVTLPTPPSLPTRTLDLTTGDPALMVGWIRDLIALDPDHVVVAGGPRGLWFLDLTDRAAPRVMARLPLETTANQLYRQGNRLYVLGTYLTIVDISNLAAPRELKQLATTTGTATAEATDLVEVPDGGDYPQAQYLYVDHGAKVTSSRITVTIDHPRPADLKIVLAPSKDSRIEPIVLWDHRSAAGGLRTLTFTSGNTPGLRVLDGSFPEGDWRVEVLDDQANGQVGRLVASRLSFATSARAARVIEGASTIAGTTSWGDLIVGGNGVEALDVSFPQVVISLGKVTGTGVRAATMVGDTVITTSLLESKDPSSTTARLKGLCAVDFRMSLLPRVVRCEAGLGGETIEHAQLAGRLYVGVFPACDRDKSECPPDRTPWTVVGDAARFARGTTWQLGRSSHRVDKAAIGDGQRLWTVGAGYLQELDVRNPAAIAPLRSYPRTYTSELVPLRLPEVLLFDGGWFARTATLGDTRYTLSRVYRITVEARDPAGAVTRASRTVHVIPYDHAPDAITATIVPGKAEGERARLRLEATDPDGGATWDPTVFGRVDWDGDGVFETDWLWMGNDGTGRFSTELEPGVAAGTYPAVIEVRDGFWARGRTTATIVVP